MSDYKIELLRNTMITVEESDQKTSQIVDWSGMDFLKGYVRKTWEIVKNTLHDAALSI